MEHFLRIVKELIRKWNSRFQTASFWTNSAATGSTAGSTVSPCPLLSTFMLQNKNITQSRFLEDISPFRGPTDTTVLDFWYCLPWVSNPGQIPHLYASSLVSNGFLRFTSGATTADLLKRR